MIKNRPVIATMSAQITVIVQMVKSTIPIRIPITFMAIWKHLIKVLPTSVIEDLNCSLSRYDLMFSIVGSSPCISSFCAVVLALGAIIHTMKYAAIGQP